MNREETHALFAQGKDAWNAWANDMLAQKKALQDAGTWDLGKDFLGNPEPKTDETKAWLNAASVIFSTSDEPHKFEQNVDFQGWIFPRDARFEKATFGGYAVFGEAEFGGNAWFEGAEFGRDAKFGEATFGGYARFEGAEFGRDAEFGGAAFAGDALFGGAAFTGSAWFEGGKFAGDARFEGVTFAGVAWFFGATIAGEAWFNGVKFESVAQFIGTTFYGFTSYQKTRFQGSAIFTAILSERTFSLEDASFQKVPDFIQAHFDEAPRLDNLTIAPACKDGDRVINVGDPNVTARWRALKRLAIQGHDYEREQYFLSNEIISARFVTDWPLRLACSKWSPPEDDADKARPLYAYIPFMLWRRSVWAGFPRFVFGILYQFFSDFGRSVWRPSLAFLSVALISAAAYLGVSESADGNNPTPFAGRLVSAATHTFADSKTLRAAHPCIIRKSQNLRPLEPELAKDTDALSEAVHLSWTNGSIVGGLGGLDSARRTYGCLYGFVEDGGKNATPILPAAVSAIATTQKLLSVILIFLFGLAIRNMLKMH